MTTPDLNDLVVLILTNGRPKQVRTYKALRNCGYTGEIRLVVDDEDDTKDEYIEKYGKEVVVFNKREMAAEVDIADNFDGFRAIIYARQASFKIAKEQGFRYFMQFDDDYTTFMWRFGERFEYLPHAPVIRSLDLVFFRLLEFFVSTNITSIAIAQGGDFIGGSESTLAESVTLLRKCMNSFLCSVDRPFKFSGRMNDDVTLYTKEGSVGMLLFTTNQVSLQQLPTQSLSGGSTDFYKKMGTYVKSFYSILYHPSSITIRPMGMVDRRLHHSIKWSFTVPRILREELRKARIDSKKV